MSKTVLNFTYTGNLCITIDDSAHARNKMSCTLNGSLVGNCNGQPIDPDDDFAVRTLTDKNIDFKDDPLGYYLYLCYVGSPANCDPLRRHRNLLNKLHKVKNEVKPLPRWKRWVIDMLNLAPAH